MVGGNWLKSIFFLFLDHLPGFPNYTFLNFQKKNFSLHPIFHSLLMRCYVVDLTLNNTKHRNRRYFNKPIILFAALRCLQFLSRQLLLRNFLLCVFLWFRNFFFFFGQNYFNVTRGTHERINATVGPETKT